MSGETYQHKDALKEAGLCYSKPKKAWYWHSGGFVKKRGYRKSLQQIRDLYGSTEIESKKPENLVFA